MVLLWWVEAQSCLREEQGDQHTALRGTDAHGQGDAGSHLSILSGPVSSAG